MMRWSVNRLKWRERKKKRSVILILRTDTVHARRSYTYSWRLRNHCLKKKSNSFSCYWNDSSFLICLDFVEFSRATHRFFFGFFSSFGLDYFDSLQTRLFKYDPIAIAHMCSEHCVFEWCVKHESSRSVIHRERHWVCYEVTG